MGKKKKGRCATPFIIIYLLNPSGCHKQSAPHGNQPTRLILREIIKTINTKNHPTFSKTDNLEKPQPSTIKQHITFRPLSLIPCLFWMLRCLLVALRCSGCACCYGSISDHSGATRTGHSIALPRKPCRSCLWLKGAARRFSALHRVLLDL